MKRYIVAVLFTASTLFSGSYSDDPKLHAFIKMMVKKHSFNKQELESLFVSVNKSELIMSKMVNPKEKRKQKTHGSWTRYANIMLTDERRELGLDFWHKHAEAIKKASTMYGVDPEVIVSIIGVETKYGTRMGDFPVIESLSTLSFSFPRRSKFFTKELEKYLIMCRDNGFDPRNPKGSYAGAMGIGQFMPSSYYAYAIDFNDDGVIDLWNVEDMIGSVAHYFSTFEWRKGELVAMKASYPKTRFNALKTGYKHVYNLDTLAHKYEITATEPTALSKMSLLKLNLVDEDILWLGAHNFFVITRYNHSTYYAMAVSQLAEQLKNSYKEKKKKSFWWN